MLKYFHGASKHENYLQKVRVKNFSMYNCYANDFCAKILLNTVVTVHVVAQDLLSDYFLLLIRQCKSSHISLLLLCLLCSTNAGNTRAEEE